MKNNLFVPYPVSDGGKQALHYRVRAISHDDEVLA